MAKPEKQVQSEIIKWIKHHGGYVIKVIKGNENGIPDLIACFSGRFVGIEVKAERYRDNPEKEMSPWQRKHSEKIKEAGGISMCVASLDDFIDAIGYYGLIDDFLS